MGILNYRVLVVDDDSMVRDITVRNLKQLGFECVTAGDGMAASEILAAQQFDAVLTDIRMPNRNGHSLACEVLQQPSRPVVVVVTGVREPKIVRDLVARGVDRVEQKPVEHIKLATCLRRLIDKERAKRPAATINTGEASRNTQSEPDSVVPVQKIATELHSNFDGVAATKSETSPTEPSPSPSNGTATSVMRRILVVDDEPMLRDIASRSFKAAGFHCDTAQDGQVAARMFDKNGYDAVVTDLQMPNRNGYSLSTELLQHPSRPVIIVAPAVTESRLADDLKSRGVAMITYKPIDHSQLAATINDLLTQEQNRHQPTGTCSPHLDDRNQSATEQATVNAVELLAADAGDVYLKCISSEHSSEAIAEQVSVSPMLRRKVLDQANSTLSHTQPRINSVSEAIVRIGQRKVSELALATPGQPVDGFK